MRRPKADYLQLQLPWQIKFYGYFMAYLEKLCFDFTWTWWKYWYLVASRMRAVTKAVLATFVGLLVQFISEHGNKRFLVHLVLPT
jgi:hypothetical protein